MAGPSQDLRSVINFFNWEGRGIAFTGLSSTTNKAERAELRTALTHLVAPENMVPPDASKGTRDHFRKIIIEKYLTPEKVLRRLLLPLLNKHLGDTNKSFWWISKKSGSIKIRGFSCSIERTGIWESVARLLESGEISFLGQCLICRKFFAKARYKQLCCSKPAKCGKTYDNRKRIELKAEARRKQREKELTRQLAQEKAALKKVFEQDILKHLPGGPSQRHKALDRYREKLESALSKADFIKQLDPGLRTILREKYQVK